jgi:glutamine synthetase
LVLELCHSERGDALSLSFRHYLMDVIELLTTSPRFVNPWMASYTRTFQFHSGSRWHKLTSGI